MPILPPSPIPEHTHSQFLSSLILVPLKGFGSDFFLPYLMCAQPSQQRQYTAGNTDSPE